MRCASSALARKTAMEPDNLFPFESQNTFITPVTPFSAQNIRPRLPLIVYPSFLDYVIYLDWGPVFASRSCPSNTHLSFVRRRAASLSVEVSTPTLCPRIWMPVI
jgi:hypothetical protein